MSRKHNTRHPNRGRSNYGQRLAARGLTKAPVMPSLDSLHSRQTRDSWLEEHPAIAVNLDVFYGRA